MQPQKEVLATQPNTLSMIIGNKVSHNQEQFSKVMSTSTLNIFFRRAVVDNKLTE
jgi:hypothetical protein